MKNTILIALLILLGTITSCNKWQKQYPEDTERTKDTPTERLTNKWWTLQSVTLNGKDYTDSVYQLFGKYQIYFSSNIRSIFNGIETFNSYVKTEIETPVQAVWRFTNNEMSFISAPENGNNSLKISIVPCYIRYVSFSTFEFNILKLSLNELKIKITNTNNDSTIINNFITD